VRSHSPHGQDAPAPPHLTFPFALKAASRLPTPFAGLQLQARSLKFPSHSNPHVLTSLLNLYAKCALPHDAQRVFDEILRPSIVSLTTLITAYMDVGRIQDTVSIARRAFIGGMHLDSFTVVKVLTACARVTDLATGEAVWKAAEQEGLSGSVFVATAAMDLYIKCGEMEKAREVFDKMPDKDAVAWGAMVGGYASNGLPRESGFVLHNAGKENEAGLLRSGGGALCVHKVGCTGFGKTGCRDVAVGRIS
jgi:pentatricopeptide repeat protein